MKLQKSPTRSDHFIGHLNAPVLLVEYGDYDCPHSMKAFAWINQIIKEYSHDLCFIYRHFPLMNLHPHAALAALGAEVAARKNKFWEMHHLLFSKDRILSSESILLMAKHIGLTEEEFIDGLECANLIDHICEDIVSGEESGVTSTPTFYINGIRLEGPLGLEILRTNIQNILTGHGLSA
jgi:protein-disulfide isomerase